ncbi:MAG TPA: transcriptional regulator NrdR [Phycisphaerae bacterium]|nr:transcriptional regulator NrdR [Phycisphaerae bacterium]
MQCPFCKEQRTDKVVDSRATEGGAVIRRRRLCLSCNKRFTTYERIEETGRLLVIKKDGSRVPFEHEKLLGGLQRACWKRPIGIEALEALVNEVEEEVFRDFDREVPSAYLGNALALRLRKLDKIAYLRFASLQQEFQLVDDFIQEAKDILDRDKQEVDGQQDLFHE